MPDKKVATPISSQIIKDYHIRWVPVVSDPYSLSDTVEQRPKVLNPYYMTQVVAYWVPFRRIEVQGFNWPARDQSDPNDLIKITAWRVPVPDGQGNMINSPTPETLGTAAVSEYGGLFIFVTGQLRHYDFPEPPGLKSFYIQAESAKHKIVRKAYFSNGNYGLFQH